MQKESGTGAQANGHEFGIDAENPFSYTPHPVHDSSLLRPASRYDFYKSVDMKHVIHRHYKQHLKQVN